MLDIIDKAAPSPWKWGICLVIADLLIYGWLIPIAGVYLAGSSSEIFDLDPFLEIILVIFFVFGMLFITFYTHLERIFWTHLFSRDEGFLRVLRIRDLANLVILVYSFSCMFYAVNDMIGDHEMKEKYLGEGLGFITLKRFVDRGWISENWLDSCQCRLKLQFPDSSNANAEESLVSDFQQFLFQWAVYLGLLPEPETVEPPVSVDCIKAKFVHGAEFVFAIASLTASMTKVVYFNTLYAYIRAMNIFISMQEEEFEDPEGQSVDEEEESEDDGPENAIETTYEVIDQVLKDKTRKQHN